MEGRHNRIMFGRKRAKESSKQPDAQAAPSAPTQTSSGGYQITELPTFHGRQRKVVVYTTDAKGKIIKTFKKA